MENPYQSGVSQTQAGRVQLGLARRELPFVGRSDGSLADLRSGGHGVDRGPLSTRAGQTGVAGGHRRVRPHAANRQFRRLATGVMQPGRDHWPQAMSLIVSGGGMRHRPDRRLDELQGGTSRRPPAHAQRPVGHRLSASGHRLRELLPRPSRPPDARFAFGEPIKELFERRSERVAASRRSADVPRVQCWFCPENACVRQFAHDQASSRCVVRPIGGTLLASPIRFIIALFKRATSTRAYR